MLVKIVSRVEKCRVSVWECSMYSYKDSPQASAEIPRSVDLTVRDRWGNESFLCIDHSVDVWIENNEGRTVDRINIEPPE